MGMSCFTEGLARYLTPEQLDCLREAQIGIAGAGGLGSNCAVMLARCGVGRFVIADHDSVEPSNLNRQQYLPGDVGRPKVEALAAVLRAINPDVAVVTQRVRLDAEVTPSIFNDCAIVVEAVDDAETKRMIVASLLGEGTFVVAASGMGGWGGAPMGSRRLGDSMVIVGDFTNEVGPGLPPLAPRVVMAAAMQADAVLQRLLGPCTGLR